MIKQLFYRLKLWLFADHYKLEAEKTMGWLCLEDKLIRVAFLKNSLKRIANCESFGGVERSAARYELAKYEQEFGEDYDENSKKS